MPAINEGAACVVNTPTSRNAQAGAITLAIGAATQLIAAAGNALAEPWAYLGWLVFCFGALCLCEELGANRPLNRAGMILLAVAFYARSSLLIFPEDVGAIRAGLLYAIGSVGVILFWSIALLHRPARSRTAGLIGSVLSGGTLALLLVGHLVAGSLGIFGFSEIFAALSNPEAGSQRAMISVGIVVCIWSAAAAGLLWTTQLRNR